MPKWIKLFKKLCATNNVGVKLPKVQPIKAAGKNMQGFKENLCYFNQMMSQTKSNLANGSTLTLELLLLIVFTHV